MNDEEFTKKLIKMISDIQKCKAVFKRIIDMYNEMEFLKKNVYSSKSSNEKFTVIEKMNLQD